MAAETIILKIGGKLLEQEEATAALISDLSMLFRQQEVVRRIAIIHGGGTAITNLTDLMGLTPTFRQGVRMTSAPEMAAVDMALCGLVNKRLARLLQSVGIPAVGIACSDGGMIIGEPIKDERHSPNYTGRAIACDPALLKTLFAAGYLPVVAPPIMDRSGSGLNLNADHAALEVGIALDADTILFCSDVEGVTIGRRGIIGELSATQVEDEIAANSIRGGMAVKTRACADALRHGVRRIVIGSCRTRGDLQRLLDGTAGTRMIP